MTITRELPGSDAVAYGAHLEEQLSQSLAANAELESRVRRAEDELRLANEALRQAKEDAERDDLIPELLSKKAVTERIEAYIAKHEAFGLFLIDLNNFKALNDTYGHRRGDKVLRDIGVLLARSFKRVADSVGMSGGRIGGDEFIVLVNLDDSGRNAASSYQEQMDNTYEFIKDLEYQFLATNTSAAKVNMGFAIGSTYYDPKAGTNLETLLDQADEAMYEEKDSKR